MRSVTSRWCHVSLCPLEGRQGTQSYSLVDTWQYLTYLISEERTNREDEVEENMKKVEDWITWMGEEAGQLIMHWHMQNGGWGFMPFAYSGYPGMYKHYCKFIIEMCKTNGIPINENM